MQTTELKVNGMTCGFCVASVTKALKRVPGVQGVEVDLGSGMARVHGERAAHQVPELVAALSEAGYEAGAATGAPAAKARSGCCRG
jgi:copper chaperone